MYVVWVDLWSNLQSMHPREVFCVPCFECAQFPRVQTVKNAQTELFAARANCEVAKTAIIYKVTETKLYLIN